MVVAERNLAVLPHRCFLPTRPAIALAVQRRPGDVPAFVAVPPQEEVIEPVYGHTLLPHLADGFKDMLDSHAVLILDPEPLSHVDDDALGRGRGSKILGAVKLVWVVLDIRLAADQKSILRTDKGHVGFLQQGMHLDDRALFGRRSRSSAEENQIE